MKVKINKVTIQTCVANLWTLPVAVAVHTTDTDLNLSRELVNLAGADLLRDVSAIGYCAVGSAVITSAGTLPLKNIIHVVGPRWGEGAERGKLASATFECLNLAETNSLKSIALPAISTGAMGYPLENCATTMLTTIVDYTFEDLKALRTIILALDDEHSLEVFDRELNSQIQSLGEEGAATV
jgi:O-acetyl-ADP-ribose deacetylase